MSEDPSGFLAFWKRWRGATEGRLANANEGREEARIQWGKLSKPHKILAHEWGPHFQKEFRKANGNDCAMLHCCRYLSKKRFLNYEDEEPPGDGFLLRPGDEGYKEWLEYKVITSKSPDARSFWSKQPVIPVPTPYPPSGVDS